MKRLKFSILLMIFLLLSCSNSNRVNKLEQNNNTEAKQKTHKKDTTDTYFDEIDSKHKIIKDKIEKIISEHPKLISTVSITKRINKYEIKDEYERFDDVKNQLNNYKKLKLNRFENIVRIINESSETFIGKDIEIEFNKNLKIENVKYNEWTDNLMNEFEIHFIVKSISLKLNTNPFYSTKNIQGQYKLVVEKYFNGEYDQEFIYKGKFKSYNGIKDIDKAWAEMQIEVLNGIIDENGVYQKVDKKFELLNDPSIILEKLKAIKKEFDFEKFKVFFTFTINEKGMIERESFMFRKDNPIGLEKKVIELFVNETKWKPAEVNNIKVRAKGMYAF